MHGKRTIPYYSSLTVIYALSVTQIERGDFAVTPIECGIRRRRSQSKRLLILAAFRFSLPSFISDPRVKSCQAKTRPHSDGPQMDSCTCIAKQRERFNAAGVQQSGHAQTPQPIGDMSHLACAALLGQTALPLASLVTAAAPAAGEDEREHARK